MDCAGFSPAKGCHHCCRRRRRRHRHGSYGIGISDCSLVCLCTPDGGDEEEDDDVDHSHGNGCSVCMGEADAASQLEENTVPGGEGSDDGDREAGAEFVSRSDTIGLGSGSRPKARECV